MTGRNVILLLNALPRMELRYVNVILVILVMENPVTVGRKYSLTGSILEVEYVAVLYYQSLSRFQPMVSSRKLKHEKRASGKSAL